MNIGYCPMSVLFIMSNGKTSGISPYKATFDYITILILIRIIQIVAYLGPIIEKCQVPDTVIALLLTLVNLRLQEEFVTL